MTMDLSTAKGMIDKVAELSRTGSLAWYREAQERGLSLSEYLEELDPSPRDEKGNFASPLDAFERLLYVLDLPTSGPNTVTVDEFFVSKGMILSAELMMREIRRGYKMVQDPGELIAVSVPVIGPSVRPIYIKTTEAQKSLALKEEGAEYPSVKLAYRDKELNIKDKGRRFDFTYKMVRNQKLTEFRNFLWWVGAQIAYDEIDDIYDIIINGDGTSSGAADYFNGTPGTLAFSDLVHLAASFQVPAQMTHILATKGDIEVILNMSQFTDPLSWRESELFARTGDYKSFRPVNAKMVVVPNATSTKLAALDRRFAIRESVSQPLILEAEKIIAQKLESAIVSKESVFSIMVEEAIALSDY
ncbi:MAG: hypothetical protein HQ591_02450 [candidate division Zixibacteria bacterium]|nr:hypothetical protein [Candidatus Tariuqbacter arcticus]